MDVFFALLWKGKRKGTDSLLLQEQKYQESSRKQLHIHRKTGGLLHWVCSYNSYSVW